MRYLIIIFFLMTINQAMAQKEIKTSILINASAETVWSLLSDFKSYENWNPFIKSISGEMQVGNKIKVNAGGMKFQPKLLAFEKQKEIRWAGRLLFSGVFDGEHSFEIIDNENGSVTFKQEERFSGILVGLFAKKLDTETREGFKAMNEQLKIEAEKMEKPLLHNVIRK